MNRKEAAELLPIIKAFSEGKVIQVKQTSGEWISSSHISLDGDPKYYRIKPEPTYRPFKDAEECWQEMLKHQPFGWVKEKERNVRTIINYIHNDGVMFSCGSVLFERLFDIYTFADGTPFGVKVEE